MESLNSTEHECAEARSKWILLAIMGVAAGVFLAGVRKDLPYSHEVDENIYVDNAVRMAASGDLNPRWFGNPGSTVIYPLVVLFHSWHAIEYGGNFLRPDKDVISAFTSDQSQFYLLGRLLTAFYALLAVLMTYCVGKRLFGERVGLLGAWFSILSPLVAYYAQVVRTDHAGSFFGMLSLWLILRLCDQPSAKNQLLTGLSIGCSVATRYFMVTLVPILIAADILIVRQRRRNPDGTSCSWRAIALGLAAAPLGFVVCTPFFVLNLPTVLRSITLEARPGHAGADGLSPAGNLAWYLTQAIPANISLPLAILAAIGALLVVIRRRPDQLLILGFLALFVLSTSLSCLHWNRWMIQILPILFLFAAQALSAAVSRLASLFRLQPKKQRLLLCLLIALASALPLHDLLLYEISDTATGTRILAREWIIRNLPPGTKVAFDASSVPLGGTDLLVFGPTLLPARGSLTEYYNAGYRYLAVSSTVYDRFFAEPGRYQKEVAFYKTLFEKGHLVKELEPSPLRGGPTIRIYRLGEPEPTEQQIQQNNKEVLR